MGIRRKRRGMLLSRVANVRWVRRPRLGASNEQLEDLPPDRSAKRHLSRQAPHTTHRRIKGQIPKPRFNREQAEAAILNREITGAPSAPTGGTLPRSGPAPVQPGQSVQVQAGQQQDWAQPPVARKSMFD